MYKLVFKYVSRDFNCDWFYLLICRISMPPIHLIACRRLWILSSCSPMRRQRRLCGSKNLPSEPFEPHQFGPRPVTLKFGLLKCCVVLTLGIFLGAFSAKTCVALLSESNIFNPEVEEDDDWLIDWLDNRPWTFFRW